MVAILRRLLCSPFVLSVGLLALSLIVSVISQAQTDPPGTAEPLTIHLPFIVSQPVEPPGSTLIPPYDPAVEQSVADQLNRQRSDNGLPALDLVPELTQAARRHVGDMAENHFTGHTGSDGSNAGERMLDAGYDWIYWGEIIGWGFGGSSESMVNWWMNSPGHRAIILDSRYEDFGVGYARNENSDWVHYWTVNFGKRATYGMALSPELHVCTFTIQNQMGGSSLVVYSSEPCQ